MFNLSFRAILSCFIAALLASSTWMLSAAEADPYTKEIADADKALRNRKFDEALETLISILERSPEHANALRMAGIALLEKGDRAQGIRAVTAAARIQGSKAAWSPEDKDLYREIEKAVLKYDIKFRDVRKADDKFIDECAKLMKIWNKDETKDIYNEILHVCMEINPGNDSVREFFAKQYTPDPYGSRTKREENPGTEVLDTEKLLGSDVQFCLDFADQTNFRRLWNMFKMTSMSNKAASPATDENYFYFDIEYGDPCAYMEHRRVPMQAGRQLRIVFEAKGEGRVILGTPKQNVGMVVEFPANKAYPYENKGQAKSFVLGQGGYGEAILQYAEDQTLTGYVNGYEIINMKLNNGQSADLMGTNVFFGIEGKPKNVRIFIIEYGPFKRVETVKEEQAVDPNAAPQPAPEDVGRSKKILEDAMVKVNTRNWEKAIPLLSDVTALDPLNWDIYKMLGDAQETAGQRRAAVDTWKQVLHRSGTWEKDSDAAKKLNAYAKERLDKIDREGKKWMDTVEVYVKDLLALRNEMKADELAVQRIDWRIKLVKPEQKLETISFDKPAAPVAGTPKIPGFEGLDEPAIVIEKDDVKKDDNNKDRKKK